MVKPLLTVQLRTTIEEYAALLATFGFHDEAEYFRLAITQIPRGTDKVSYKNELLKLIGLRLDCYDIPSEKPEFAAGFLSIQSFNLIFH